MTTHELPAGKVSPSTVRRSTPAAVRFTRAGCLLVASLLCVSCSTGPKLDPDWNSQRLWQQVANPPPTYVPTGYAASRPCSDRDGTWFTDARDGKRLFVPKDGTPGWAPGVLAGEAKKAIGYKPPGPTGREKAQWFTAFLLGAFRGTGEAPPLD